LKPHHQEAQPRALQPVLGQQVWLADGLLLSSGPVREEALLAFEQLEGAEVLEVVVESALEDPEVVEPAVLDQVE